MMSALVEKEFRTAIEDARVRHAAVIALIYHTDQQAAGLLRIFLTVGVAAVSACFATASTMRPVAYALGGAAVMTVIGSVFCLLAMRSGKMRLPGNEPDFWIWAMQDEVSQGSVLRTYLEQLQSGASMNAKLNRKTAGALKYAKVMVVASILAALIAGGAASRSIYF